jgi:creatinine amidohydrolase
MLSVVLLGLLATGAVAQEPSHRNVNDLNWIEFRELVPEKINTLLLPVGTLEAHGVANNGADNTAPVALAEEIAPKVNALIAPVIPYGVTSSLAEYPGSFKVSEPVFEAYVREVVQGFARNRFKNIILINGHGPNRAPLNRVAEAVAANSDARILVFNWWSYTADITKEVFGQDGGHAGINENAMIQAIDPSLVHRRYYSEEMASAIDPSVSAFPNPSTILLYTAGEGYPDFDQKKAEQYFSKVVEKCTRLIQDTIRKWDAAGL